MGAVTLALLLLTQPLDCAPCEEARRSNLEHAITWQGRAHEARISARSCMDRLAVRTSTPTPAVVRFEAIDSEWSVPKLMLGGTLVFLSGIAAGLLIALAAK